ncbi:Txe/YoeB family addiction module toxin [Actinomyces sp. oral taxon 897]|uniref:Txe/YoeB family addiction module toxin n=1 Tax=Actinomyces sp. oral taxon 897 TaxID=2081702 RepID=UPI000D025C0B|nr:Txe/YoeB family addiction module toxin [Actinomyces sp. oral taxon 897]AVM60909.1 Txe/YoeB family addiction module toxin [Actinomyces sp. oral taxon 897]
MTLIWSDQAWEDYLWWQLHDRKVRRRINLLLHDIQRSGHEGIGKPEPLRYQLTGHWSRRITDEHRLVYRIDDGGDIHIVACRHHYGD